MHGPVSTQDDSQAELFLLLRPWAPGTGSAQGAGSARRKSVTGTQSDLVRRALQQETVLLSGSRVGLPSGPPAPASTAGSPCERKPPATWVATPPPPEVRGPTAIRRGTTCPAPLCRALDPLTHSERYPAHSTARGTWWLFHGPRYQVTTRQALCAAVRGRYAQWECCQQGDLRCQRDCTQPGHRGKGPGDRAQARAELGCGGDREQR